MIRSKQKFDRFICGLMVFMFAILMKSAFISAYVSRDKHASQKIIPHFSNVSIQANVAHTGKSVNAIWLDDNDDGWLDLFLCNGYNQPNVLYRNLKNGAFEDITTQVGLVDFRWSHG
ncbi:MAG: VCBS repeat-containing protein, partial [candidate division KSB1 bacterium]|nr:VCBS repeat-containing protein [candidate division KSB1 bacterium]